MRDKAQQLSNAIELATQRHNGQFDKGGYPYILHCLKVMHYTKSDDLEIQAIAVMHDLIEDTFNDWQEGIQFLLSRGFSDRVIDGVLSMTKLDGQSFESYKEQVRDNPDAVIVKMADLRHNSDIRRLKGVTQKDIERMVRYQQFYQELKALRGQ